MPILQGLKYFTGTLTSNPSRHFSRQNDLTTCVNSGVSPCYRYGRTERKLIIVQAASNTATSSSVTGTASLYSGCGAISPSRPLGIVAVHDQRIMPDDIVQIACEQNREGRFFDTSFLIADGNVYRCVFHSAYIYWDLSVSFVIELLDSFICS